MAFVKLQNRDYVTSFSVENAESDYGSDLDQDAEQILDGVLSLIEAAALKPLVLESIDEDAPLSDPRTAIVPKVAENNCTLEVDLGQRILSRTALETPVEIEYDEPSRTAFRGESWLSTKRSTFTTDVLTAFSCTRWQARARTR